jgi:predicted anti-sigma-YlaC factor YlaD
MHRPIEDRLETYLHGGPGDLSEFHRHLADCSECRDEVGRMQDQARTLRTLRPSEEVAPAAGFYARVMDRIQARKSASVWWAFVDPVFSRRIAYATLALMVLLGLSMMSTDPLMELNESSPEVLLTEEIVAPRVVFDDMDEGRAQLLGTLASFSEE